MKITTNLVKAPWVPVQLCILLESEEEARQLMKKLTYDQEHGEAWTRIKTLKETLRKLVGD
jgi:negative regulator of sigma E activity